MSKFKAGDRILCITSLNEDTNKIKVGHVYTMKQYNPCGLIELEGVGSYWTPSQFVIHLHPNPPHKHAELIKAWADGAEIEVEVNSAIGNGKGEFTGCIDEDLPKWNVTANYRIKPEKTANQIEIERIESEMRKLADDLSNLKDS